MGDPLVYQAKQPPPCGRFPFGGALPVRGITQGVPRDYPGGAQGVPRESPGSPPGMPRVSSMPLVQSCECSQDFPVQEPDKPAAAPATSGAQTKRPRQSAASSSARAHLAHLKRGSEPLKVSLCSLLSLLLRVSCQHILEDTLRGSFRILPIIQIVIELESPTGSLLPALAATRRCLLSSRKPPQSFVRHCSHHCFGRS